MPAVVGQYLKYEIQHKVANQQLPNYTVKLLSYNAGWFNSTARFVISPHKGELQQASNSLLKEQQVNMNVRIFHGPLVCARNLTGHQLWFWGQGILKGEAKIADLPLQVFLKMHFNNDISMRLQNLGYQYHQPDKSITINFASLISHIKITQDMHKIAGDTVLQKVTIISRSIQASVPQLVTHFNLAKDASGIWFGHRDNLIPLIALKFGAASIGTMTELAINSQTQIANNFLQGTMTGTIAKVALPVVQSFGPININYKMTNVEVSKLNALNQFLSKTDLSADNPNREQVDERLMVYIADLVQGSTQDLTNFSVMTPQGLINLSFHIQLPKEAINVKQVMDRETVINLYKQLWQQAQANLKVNVPSKLVELFLQRKNQLWNTQFNLLQTVGAIKSSNNDFSTELNYDRGTILVNGVLLQNVINSYKAAVQKLQVQNQPRNQLIPLQPPTQPLPHTAPASQGQATSPGLPETILRLLQH